MRKIVEAHVLEFGAYWNIVEDTAKGCSTHCLPEVWHVNIIVRLRTALEAVLDTDSNTSPVRNLKAALQLVCM